MNQKYAACCFIRWNGDRPPTIKFHSKERKKTLTEFIYEWAGFEALCFLYRSFSIAN